MTGQNDREDESLTGQVCDQAGHCPLTGRYFQPCSSRPKLSDLYTLSQSKLLQNHTLHSGTYLYSPYMPVPPTPGALSIKFSTELT